MSIAMASTVPYWILDDEGEPKPVDDVLTWARFFENAPSRIVLQHYPTPRIFVSTVFLGVDHGFRSDAPVLWETMIFGSVFDGYQARYTSRLNALTGHQVALSLVELYRSAPRRTKKALLKTQQYDRRIRLVEDRRRLQPALRRIGAGDALL